MAHLLTEREITEIVAVLSTTYVVDICGGSTRIISAQLPGKAVCAAKRADDRLFIVVDLEKPLAHRHARQMLREWRDGFYEPVVDRTTGTVELVPLSPTPEPDGAAYGLSLVL